MKKYSIIFLSFFVFSCTDLVLEPEFADIDQVVFQDPESYRSYLAKIYGSYSLTGQDGPTGDSDISIVNDEGFTSYIRAYWKAQELTTDEAVIGWDDAGIRDLHNHSWSSENQFVRVLYYRIFFIIAYANDFLDQSTDSKLDQFGINEEWKAEIKTYRAEARFLRAMAYWHALDLFGSVGLTTTTTSQLPTQASPQELFEFIESELIEIEDDMAAPQANEYGRADRGALWMLQAKLYLNAEVYTNVAKNDEVITAINKITGAGYSLHNKYSDLFLSDNHKWTDEIIFALNSDAFNTQNYGNTTFLVHASIGGFMDDNIQDGTEDELNKENEVPEDREAATKYGVGGGWGGLRTTSTMVEQFYINGDANQLDPRQSFYTNGQELAIADLSEFHDGYAVSKWKNISSTGDLGTHAEFVDTDYPIFRLADAYLMYAEAVLRGGAGGDRSTALTYVNALRERAYGDVSGNILDADLTLDFILDERTRELHWEGTRRVDLIRYGQFSDQGVWPWKGGVAEGTTTSTHLNIFPIPASDLNVNVNMVQNAGY